MLTTSLRSALWITLLALASCGSPPPTCSATAETYRICSDDQVWECPVATAEQVAAKKAITDACAGDTKCILDAKYEMFEMTLVAKCKEGGQVCVQAGMPAARTASCQLP